MLKIKFKTGEKVFEADRVLENKVYRDGVKAGWLLTLCLIGSITSNELDELLNEENLSEITLSYDIPEGENIKTVTKVLGGYTKESSCLIRHANEPSKTRTEISLLKGV